MSGLELSDRQKTTLAAAITILSGFVILCAVGGILVLLALFVGRFSNVFLPLAVAAVSALVLKPYYDLLHIRFKLPAALALVAVFVSILIPFAAFMGFFGTIAFQQLGDLFEHLPEYRQQITEWVQGRSPEVVRFFEETETGRLLRQAVEGKEAALAEQLQKVSGQAFSAAGRVLGWVGTLLSWAVMPVYLAFFLLFQPVKVTHLDNALPFLKKDTRDDVIYLAKEFLIIIVAFFRGQFIIAFMQGVLYAIGFSVAGLKYGLVLGLMLGFLNIIPYLGSIVGLSIALPLAFFQEGGGIWLVVAVVVVFTVVQLIESYILTPRVMGDRTGLHPMAIIVAVFFWGSALGGISGMLLAIPLTAFLVVFWRLLREKYIGELV